MIQLRNLDYFVKLIKLLVKNQNNEKPITYKTYGFN